DLGVGVIGELTAVLGAAAWESVTLGEVAMGLGTAVGGGGLVVVGRRLAVALAAGVRALEAWTRHLEATTSAARAAAGLAPVLAALLRAQLADRVVKPPPELDDSDELRVLRVAVDGDDDEIALLVGQLAAVDTGSTLPTNLGRALRRLEQLQREAQRRRAHPDAPRPRGRESSWWRRRKAQA